MSAIVTPLNNNSKSSFPANLGKILTPSNTNKSFIRIFPYVLDRKETLLELIPENNFESAVLKAVTISINRMGFLELPHLGISFDSSYNDGGWCSLHRFFKYTLPIPPLKNFDFDLKDPWGFDNETNSDFEGCSDSEESFDFEENFFCSKLKEERELLNLNLTETNLDLVNASFRKLALQHHPDKGGDVELFKKIRNAYEEILKELESYLKNSG